jgi:5-(carboxyamino)imidazole ribonucleotide synthase
VVISLTKILPPQTIGILGGGQLGRMMAIAAREMGYSVAVLDPQKNSPCGQIADTEIVTAYDSIEGIEKLAKASDIVTYEFENVDFQASTWLENHAYLPQGSQLLRITQDRQIEKETLTKIGIPISKNIVITDESEIETAVNTLGYPSVLKTCRGGYDGKGQVVIESGSDLAAAKELLTGNRACVLEKWVNYTTEISVIVARNKDGEINTFPVGENIHKDNILYKSIVPARITQKLSKRAEDIAITIAEGLELVGTLAVEMFVTENGEIVVNELAPRPHNSGHYTIEACEVSQFQQHIRAICNWKLGATELLKPAVMVNLLGEDAVNILDIAPNYSDLHLHLYGKAEVKDKRKMGHITVLGSTIEEAITKADKIIGMLEDIRTGKLEVIK